MRFAFIAKHRNIWPVAWLCDALDVSRSGFHAWLNRSPRVRSRQDEVLVTAIDRSFKSSDRTYGARRVWHDVLAEGLSCGLHRIERLMRENGLRVRPRRRGLRKDTGERAAVSDNLLDRAFEASAPNQKWIADFTYIWNRRRMALRRRRRRPVLPPCRRLGDEGGLDNAKFTNRLVGMGCQRLETSRLTTEFYCETDTGLTARSSDARRPASVARKARSECVVIKRTPR